MPTRRISHSVPASEPRWRPALAAQLQRQAPPLAMVGLGQVDEFEVEREGARQQDGAIDGQRMDQFERGGGVARGLFVRCRAPRHRGGGSCPGAALRRARRGRRRPARAAPRPAACPASAHRGAAALLSDRRTALQVQPAAATSFRDSTRAPSSFDYARWIRPSKESSASAEHRLGRFGPSLLCGPLRRKQVGLWSLTIPEACMKA